MPCASKVDVRPRATAMVATFSRIGVAAGIAKRPQVLRMPADNATIDMKPT